MLHSRLSCSFLSFPLSVSEILGCGFSSKEETGVIKSQDWPMNYKANTECMWNIKVPSGKKITLTFTHFDLEAKDALTSTCYDNIMVYDINGLTSALIQSYGKQVFTAANVCSPNNLYLQSESK